MHAWTYYFATVRSYTKDVPHMQRSQLIKKRQYSTCTLLILSEVQLFQIYKVFLHVNRKNESCGKQIFPQVNLFNFIISSVWDGIIFQDYLPLENIQPDQVSHFPRNKSQRRRRERCSCLSKHT